MLSFISRLNFFIKYSCIENKKRLVHYFLCIFSCFLVGLVCLISKTIINQGPIIFLMITEQKTGENDIIIRPHSSKIYDKKNISDYQFFNSHINYTMFKELFKDNHFQSTPRIQMLGEAWMTDPSKKNYSANNITHSKDQNKNKYKDNKISISLFIIDLKNEKKIELGSSFPDIKLEENECLIHKNVARLLNLDSDNLENKSINISINLEPFLTNFLIKTYYLNLTHEFNPNITNIPFITSFNIIFPCKVKKLLEENYGKIDQDVHSTVIMEFSNFHKYIADYINPKIVVLFPDIKQVIKNQINLIDKNKFSSYDYANFMIVNFPKPRVNTYTVANFDDLQMLGVSYANIIVEQLGSLKTNFDIRLPIIENIKPFFNGAVFLGIILNLIIICLFGLSVLLIFSLLQISVETRVFEFGILRIIGSTKFNIIVLILTQCITFSIPSFILAYISHIYILNLIQNGISSLTETNLKLNQEVGSIIYALVMTNLVPLLSAFYPIKAVFKDSLAFSLNSNINKTSGVKIEVFSALKNEKYSLIVCGFLIFLYGISIYYFLPLSMLSMNWGLLLFILLWILLGMLGGWIILSFNLEYLIQKFVLYTCFFWAKTSDKILIIKNLTAHRIRNRKTAIMYSLSVGFFILLDVGLKIELKTQELMSLQRTGTYFQLTNADGRMIKPSQIFPTVYTMKKLNLIESYTFITPELNYFCYGSKTYLSNLGKMEYHSVDLLGVPGNYFDTALEDFLDIDEEDNINLSLSDKLYLDKYNSGMGISGIFVWEADIRMKNNFYLNVVRNNKKYSIIYEPSFILHSAPGLKMTSEPLNMIQRSVVVSAPNYLDLLNKCYIYLIDLDQSSFGGTKQILDLKMKNKNEDKKKHKKFLLHDETFKEYSKFYKNDNNRFFTLSDFPISRILFKLKSQKSRIELFDTLADIVNYDSSYLVNTWSFYDYEKKLNRISTITSIIFNSINIITLAFCFFNLSASMTINIKEQQKEISIIRSIGLTKYRLNFIYQAEAFVLIFTACIIGVMVGTLVSFTMTLQQVIFTNLPITFVFPFMKLAYLFVVSMISGSLSTIIPAKIMLDQSISSLIKNS